MATSSGNRGTSGRPSSAPATLAELFALEPYTRNEEVRFWRPVDLDGVELMTAVNCDRLWRVFHDTYTFCVIPRRRNRDTELAVVRYRGRASVYRPATVGMMEPGEAHANLRNRSAADFWVLLVDPQHLTTAAVELDLPAPPHFRGFITAAPAVVSAFTRFYRALSSGVGVLEQEVRFSDCIRVVLETCGERRLKRAATGLHAGVRHARDYIHMHFARAIRLDELAAVSGLSRFHLVRSFARAYGLPPQTYQNRLRVAVMRRLLRSGVPLTDIDVGFYDQSHAIRHFKQILQVTPGQYAAAPRGPLPPFA